MSILHWHRNAVQITDRENREEFDCISTYIQR